MRTHLSGFIQPITRANFESTYTLPDSFCVVIKTIAGRPSIYTKPDSFHAVVKAIAGVHKEAFYLHKERFFLHVLCRFGRETQRFRKSGRALCIGPRVPFVPLPFGNLAFFFWSLERCLFNFVYVCMYEVRFPIKSTKQKVIRHVSGRFLCRKILMLFTLQLNGFVLARNRLWYSVNEACISFLKPRIPCQMDIFLHRKVLTESRCMCNNNNAVSTLMVPSLFFQSPIQASLLPQERSELNKLALECFISKSQSLFWRRQCFWTCVFSHAEVFLGK